MSSYVVRATAAEMEIRAFFAQTTEMVEKARITHNLSPAATMILGRGITAAAIMSKFMKGASDTVTLQFKGSGQLEGMVIIATADGNIRGYVYNNDAELPTDKDGNINVGGILGNRGYLNVIKDYGLKEPYTGLVNLVSGEIAEDIAYYYAYSEQTPSVVALGVYLDKDGKVLHAGGYFIQLLPGATEETISFLENKLSNVESVTIMMKDGLKPEEILKKILQEKEINILENTACQYKCNCSIEKMEKNMISLGVKEINEIIEEQGAIEIICHFCKKRYYFSKEELNLILNEIQNK